MGDGMGRCFPLNREVETVTEQVANLVAATRALLTYMEESLVFDKLADAGCGGVDAYRSEQFDDLIGNARRAIVDLEKTVR
jgi:hypothetical protein